MISSVIEPFRGLFLEDTQETSPDSTTVVKFESISSNLARFLDLPYDFCLKMCSAFDKLPQELRFKVYYVLFGLEPTQYGTTNSDSTRFIDLPGDIVLDLADVLFDLPLGIRLEVFDVLFKEGYSDTEVEVDPTQGATTTKFDSCRFLDLPLIIRRLVYDILPEPTFHEISLPCCYLAYSDYTPVSNLRRTSVYLNKEAGAFIDIQRAIALSHRDLVIAVKPYDASNEVEAPLRRIIGIFAALQGRTFTNYAAASAAIKEPEPDFNRDVLEMLFCDGGLFGTGVKVPRDAFVSGLEVGLTTMLLQLRKNPKVQIRWYQDQSDDLAIMYTQFNIQLTKGYAKENYEKLECEIVIVLKDEATRDAYKKYDKSWPHDSVTYEIASAEEAARVFK